MIHLVKSSILNVQYEGKATFNVSSSSLKAGLSKNNGYFENLKKVGLNNKDTDTYNI